jgi:hypothetical protein
VGVGADEVERRGRDLCLGVPHVVAVADAPRLAEAWLEAVDAFPQGLWEISMYALGLAAAKLKMPVELSYDVLGFSYPLDGPVARDMIHYCYGDKRWSKHFYRDEEGARRVWEPQVTAPPGTNLGEILSQLREARTFYHRLTF